MKRSNIRYLLILGCFFSCNKKELSIQPISSVNVVNAVVDGTTVKVNEIVNDSAGSFTGKIFAIPTRENNLMVYPTNNPSVPYYNAPLNAAAGDLYSLYLGGTNDAPDAILVKDIIPYRADSTFGVRFVNLSYNSYPISVNLKGDSPGTEVTSLQYKSVSAFKSYSADAQPNHLAYEFVISNALTGDSVTSYLFQPLPNNGFPDNPIPRFFNVTLVWKGKIGDVSVNSPSILRVNNY